MRALPTDRKIRVLNITEEGRGGGALYRIMDIADELRDHADTIIVYPSSSTKITEAISRRGLHGVGISLSALTRHWSGLIRYLLTWPVEIVRLRSIILSHAPDIVYANGSWQIKGIIAAQWCGVPSIWHQNDMQQPWPVRMLYKWTAPNASSIVYASQRTADYYSDTYSPHQDQHCTIISAPVDTDRFIPDGATVNLNPNTYNVLTTGYINPNKGLEYLIQAAGLIQKNHAERAVSFYIIGPVLDSQRAYRARLDQLTNELQLENIHFVGYQYNTDEWLRAADAYVCCSVVESSPIALWEAMSCGTYSISTDVGDVSELSQYNKSITVVPIADAAAMADAIVQSIDDPHRDMKRKKARETAIERMSLSVVGQQHLSLYHDVIESCG